MCRLFLLLPRWSGVFKRADHITAISNYLGAWARRMGAHCPVTVIPNGVDTTKFEARNSKHEINLKSKVIIHTGRLVKKNGVDILVEAMKFLSNNVQLQILGDGIEEKNLKLQATSYKLQARVEFLGHVPPNEVPNYLAQADVFCRPSRSEGLGNSFLEAMAAGVPVVGTPVGGIPDFLIDGQTGLPRPRLPDGQGQTGWFCEVDNPKSVAEKIEYILDPVNHDKVEQVINEARQMVLNKYNWEIIAKQMSGIFSL